MPIIFSTIPTLIPVSRPDATRVFFQAPDDALLAAVVAEVASILGRHQAYVFHEPSEVPAGRTPVVLNLGPGRGDNPPLRQPISLEHVQSLRDATGEPMAAPPTDSVTAPVQSGLVATMLDALRHAQKVLNHNNLHLECGPVNAAILAARAPADSAEPAGAGYAALPESLMLAVDRWFADNTGLGGCSGKDVRGLAELFYDVTYEGGRESVDDALAIVESFGPGIGGLNDTYARQVLLAAEVTRLRGIYKSAVAGRASMRDALRASHGQAPAQPAGPCAICGSDEPFTGTCGSGDPRALCKQPSTSPQAAQQAPAKLVEAVTKAILFEDTGSSEGWEENTNLGEAAIRVCDARNPPRCSYCHSATGAPLAAPPC